MKITNFGAFKAAMDQAVAHAIATKVVPAVKGAVLEMAERVIQGGDGYVGTPEWKGNAVANWYADFDAPVTTFTQFFDDPPAPDDDDYEVASEYSAKNPREAAVQMSLDRVRAKLRGGPALPTKIFITNTAPYLGLYEPYKEGGPLPRASNIFPMSTARAAARISAKLAVAGKTQGQLAAWRAKVTT
jgi:hypothetical protein